MGGAGTALGSTWGKPQAPGGHGQKQTARGLTRPPLPRWLRSLSESLASWLTVIYPRKACLPLISPGASPSGDSKDMLRVCKGPPEPRTTDGGLAQASSYCLEARGLRSGCHGLVSSEVRREGPFQASPGSGDCGKPLVFLGLWTHHPHVCLCLHVIPLCLHLLLV